MWAPALDAFHRYLIAVDNEALDVGLAGRPDLRSGVAGLPHDERTTAQLTLRDEVLQRLAHRAIVGLRDIVRLWPSCGQASCRRIDVIAFPLVDR
jgi:hypothetical protein